jgi:hypothetical protein
VSVERDLLGWELDDVLEGYDVDYTVDTCALDPEISAQLEHTSKYDEVLEIASADPTAAEIRAQIYGETS